MMSNALMLGLLLAGCDKWTPESALKPVFEMVDDDGSGAIDPAEWARRQYAVGEIDTVDVDGDEKLDINEFQQVLASSDPLLFDGSHTRRVPSPEDAQTYFPTPWNEQVLVEVLAFMAAEISHQNTDIPLPSQEEMRAACTAGDPTDPAFQAILTQLATGYEKVGLQVPAFAHP